MRLDLKTRKNICGKIFRRYQKAGKKDKGEILDEYTQTLECNRDYLAHLLANWGKTRYAPSNGKPVRYTAKPPVKNRKKAPGSKKTGRPEKYDKAFVKVLADIWDFSTLNAGNSWLPCLGGHRLFGP